MGKKKSGQCCTCHEKAEQAIGNIFHKFGEFVSRHPWKILLFILALNGGLGVGMIKMKQDIDVSRVYTPINSQASQDEQKILKIFPDKSAYEFLGYQLTIQSQEATVYLKPNSGNILDAAFLQEVPKIIDAVNATTAELNGETLTFQGLCARNRGDCVIDGEVFTSDLFQASAVARNITYPTFISSTGSPVNLQSLLGGPQVNTNGILTEATHLRLQFNLRADTVDWVEKAAEWFEKFVETMDAFSNSQFDFAYGHSDSLSTELNSNIGGDIAFFSVTFTLMITYACVATYAASNDCVGNRMILGFCGVLAAGLGIVASLGLVSACGMSFVSIVGNMPFLILGIGVDDMFVLLSGLTQAGFAGTVQSKIGGMMRISGVAITITSLTNILAFACGAASTFKSVRNFCVYTGVAIIFCYINQTTFFTACLSINEKRIEGQRHFVCCCKSVKSKNEYKVDKAPRSTVFCCGGQKPEKRQDVDSWLERFPGWFLPKLVLNIPGKITILCCFLVYLAIGIWGAVNLQQGLILKNLVSEDSYYYKFITWKDDHFVTHVPVAFVMEGNVQYSSSSTQSTVSNLISRASSNEFMSNSSISWLDSYVNSPHYNSASEAAFIANLYTFFDDPRFSRFRNDVKISADNSSIIASRVYVFTVDIARSQDSGQMMLDMRDVASNTPGLMVTAFAPSFIFYEQYVSILPQTLQTLGTSLAAVFLITAFFMPHPLLLLYIVVTMAMIIVGIIGFMHHWGLTLSSITMIHIIMSVGFSVDYTAHTCHAFMVASGKDRNERVRKALLASGSPIFNGAVSSVIGILMLVFAKSYIFNSFFKVMLLVVLFGIAHSVLFLPVVLSVIGPGKDSEEDSGESDIQNGKVSPAQDNEMYAVEKKRPSSTTSRRSLNDVNSHVV